MHLEHLKETGTGKRLFIIGNGPSLTPSDLELIVGEDSIGMNRVSQIFGSTSWRPSYYLCTTSNVQFEDWRADIVKGQRLGVPFFMWDKLIPSLSPTPNSILLNCVDGELDFREVTDETWSDSPQVSVSKFGTSMFVAFQLAAYMNYSEVVILGADLGFRVTLLQKLAAKLRMTKLFRSLDRNHFAKGYGTPGAPPDVLNCNMLVAHRIARDKMEARGIFVLNASREVRNLEIWPIASLADLLPSKRVIRENE